MTELSDDSPFSDAAGGELDRPTLRMLDASLNRAAEGLRTIEEVARFVLDDRSMAGALKTLRHELASIAQTVPRIELLRSRNTAGDVGTTIMGDGESDRHGLGSVVAAASSRVSQSLRVIEETMKTSSFRDCPVAKTDTTPAALAESIRYRLYDLAVAVETTLSRHPRREMLASCVVYGLITADTDEDSFCQNIQQLIQAGVNVIQLRDSTVNDRTLYERAMVGSRLVKKLGGLLIVNDRADIAAAAQADGVHVGQDELPPSEARKIVGPNCLVGLSTHDLQQVKSAGEQPIDYIGCGPIFPSGTKSFDTYTGTTWLAEVPQIFDRPAFAIGGIDLTNVSQVIAAGINRVAVSGSLKESPEQLVATLRTAVDRSGPSGE